MQRLLWIFGLGGVDLRGPLVIYEDKRMPKLRWGGLRQFFDLIGGFEFLLALPGFSIPFAHWLWRVPTILVSAVLVSREIEGRTWNTLRVTTLSVREIMLAKYAAVFHFMEPHLILVVAVRAVPTLVVGVSWLVSTLTVLPEQGFDYWFSTSMAFLSMGIYFLFSPLLDVAVDGALGLLASSYAERRSTALLMAMLARLTGWLLPLALAMPLQYGLLNSVLGVSQLDVVALKAIAVVSTFGPTYAFLWGVPQWISVGVVAVFLFGRLVLARVMFEAAVRRVERLDLV